MNTLDTDMKKSLAESIPPSIRVVVEDLLANPLWLKICSIIYGDVNAQMSQPKLIDIMNDFIEENKIHYVELNETFDKLLEKGYICLEARSMPHYFLTPVGVEAMEVIDTIEKQIIKALVEELEKKGLTGTDVEKCARQYVYSKLTST